MKVVLLKPGHEELLRRAEAIFNPMDISIERAAMLLREPSYLMIAALDDNDAVLGRIYANVLHRFEATDLLLYEVDVDEEHQRKGVGRAMIDFLSKLSAERGYREMWVLTDLDNEAGNALYKSAGGQLENSPANMYVFPIAKR
ncbi:MAG TPA: GNAT family N-acetyltransferase [Rhizomicrobium sp.]